MTDCPDCRVIPLSAPGQQITLLCPPCRRRVAVVRTPRTLSALAVAAGVRVVDGDPQVCRERRTCVDCGANAQSCRAGVWRCLPCQRRRVREGRA